MSKSRFISEHTLIHRINRALKREKRRLKRDTVLGPEYADLGQHYIVDSRFHYIEPNVDIEDLGLYLGVLKDGEFYMPPPYPLVSVESMENEFLLQKQIRQKANKRKRQLLLTGESLVAE